MARFSLAFFALISAAIIPIGASAQTLDGAWVYPGYPGYPGSFLIAPQDSSFTAPGIYRSLNSLNDLGNPVQVDRICANDIKAMFKKHVFSQQLSTAPGVQNVVSLSIRATASVNPANLIKFEVAGQYEQVVKLTTGPVRVLSSDDDTLATDVLRNVKVKCRGVIREHLRQNRLVFVAAKAIQAHDYSAETQRIPSARLSGGCTSLLSWCRWLGPQGEVTGQYSSSSRSLAQNKYVTIALVPAQI